MYPTTGGRTAGLASATVALGTTLLAAVVSPTFSWTGNALSELGVAWTAVGTPATVALFNGGLVLGALFGLVFAGALYRGGETRLERATGIAFGMTTASMGGVGLFPVGTALHVPTAVGFYVLITVTASLAVVPAVRRGARWYGVASLTVAVGNLGTWIGWLALGGPGVVGLAVPELAGAVLLAAWVALTVSRSSRFRPPSGGRPSRTVR